MNYICLCDYKPRTIPPSEKNKYYISCKKGGYNRAKIIVAKTGFVLSDCTGLVHGMFLEAAKNTDFLVCDKLHIGDAKNYWKKKDGYKRGQTPRLGAVACWGGEPDGHVGIVIKVIDYGKKIQVAMSEYGGKRFYTRTISRKADGGYSYKTAKYSWTWQGFIYNPYILMPKGKIKVITDNLRIREKPTTTSKIMGYTVKHKTYDFYETTTKEGYTWFRIATNKWVADNGHWVKIL